MIRLIPAALPQATELEPFRLILPDIYPNPAAMKPLPICNHRQGMGHKKS